MAGPSYGYVPQPNMGGERPTSGLAIAGLITAIIPFTALLGLILSFIAIFLTGPSAPKKGRGLAISGTIVGIIWCVIGVVLVYGAMSFMSFVTNDGQKVLMYGMELRAERYHEVHGVYPENISEFWDSSLNHVTIENQQGGDMDLSGFASLIEYKRQADNPTRPFTLHSMEVNWTEGGAKTEHAYGVNPLPDLRKRLSGHMFVGDEAANSICDAIQKYFDELKEKPFMTPVTPVSMPSPAGQ